MAVVQKPHPEAAATPGCLEKLPGHRGVWQEAVGVDRTPESQRSAEDEGEGFPVDRTALHALQHYQCGSTHGVLFLSDQTQILALPNVAARFCIPLRGYQQRSRFLAEPRLNTEPPRPPPVSHAAPQPSHAAPPRVGQNSGRHRGHARIGWGTRHARFVDAAVRHSLLMPYRATEQGIC